MPNEIFFMVNESLDGGYEANAVGHSIYTNCDTYDELYEVLRDAVECHFEPDEKPSLMNIDINEFYNLL